MANPGLFATADGTAVTAVTAAEMLHIDNEAVDGAGPALLQMMENAGRNLAEEVLDLAARRLGLIVILAGSGGNGGGAICAARHLANHGVATALVLTRPSERLSPAATQQLEIYAETNGQFHAADDVGSLVPGVIIDGLIGYGLRGAPRGPTAALIQWCNGSPAPVVSLDVPSGIDSTTGVAPGDYVRPDRTLTLALPKTGLATVQTGELILADIGIPAGVYARAGIDHESPFPGGYRVPLQRRPAP
jgi:NAD(P)H-hydrate epimerase